MGLFDKLKRKPKTVVMQPLSKEELKALWQRGELTAHEYREALEAYDRVVKPKQP